MQLGARFHEPICFLSLDAFAPVRKVLVAEPARLQDVAMQILRAPDPSDTAITQELAHYPLLFAPTHLGGLLDKWYGTTLQPELTVLVNVVFPFDAEARQNHDRFRAMFASPAPFDSALVHYSKTESALFTAFASVESTIVSSNVTDRDIAIIEANLRLDLNRDATHHFHMMLMRFIRARIICDFFAASRVKQSQVEHFAAETGIPLTTTHLEGLWARVH
jgi:hypothetical protein